MWLRRCCLEEDEWDDADPLQQYLARVGTWLVMAIVARVMQPGCKFDYMVIFEGAQGVGKSTLARLLGGDHFADTGLVLGDKDSYQNLQGVLVYEWGELDSLTKTEVTKVKQFISSMKDRFRASFDRRAKDYPRQVVFIGTTNEDHYLVDPTGNRRMWPVRVTRQIDLEWFAEHRDQLFAEALHCLDAGERFHPNTREQRELFEPQQQQRQIENAIQAAILRYLYDEHQKVGMHGENGTLVHDITAPELLTRLGISVDKQTQALLRQATAAMRHAGWVRYRSSRGDRPWMFKRPAGGKLPEPDSSTGPMRGHQQAGDPDAMPF
jgi:predicted P-loop ATPase